MGNSSRFRSLYGSPGGPTATFGPDAVSFKSAGERGTAAGHNADAQQRLARCGGFRSVLRSRRQLAPDDCPFGHLYFRIVAPGFALVTMGCMAAFADREAALGARAAATVPGKRVGSRPLSGLQSSLGNCGLARLVAATRGGRVRRGILQRQWTKTDRFPDPAILAWSDPISGREWFYNSRTGGYFYVVSYGTWLGHEAMDAQFEERPSNEWDGVFPVELHPPITDAGLVACIKVLADTTNMRAYKLQAFREDLVRRVGARVEPEGAQIEAFAQAVLLSLRGYLGDGLKWKWSEAEKRYRYGPSSACFIEMDEDGGNPVDVGGALSTLESTYRRAIFKNVGGYMEEEQGFTAETGFPKAHTYQLGIQSLTMRVEGLSLHFTRRAANDADAVTAQWKRLVEVIRSIRPEELAKSAGSAELFAESLTTLVDTTRASGRPTEIRGIAEDVAKRVKPGQLKELWAQTCRRWGDALRIGKIHVVFDRAGLRDAYGAAEANELGPKTLMEGGGLDKGQRIIINLDASPVEHLPVTLAHELAHVIGFNPTGIDPHGHFSAIERYKEAERATEVAGGPVPTLLFDAYYFETVIRSLL